jgi:hypothetical protein
MAPPSSGPPLPFTSLFTASAIAACVAEVRVRLASDGRRVSKEGEKEGMRDFSDRRVFCARAPFWLGPDSCPSTESTGALDVRRHHPVAVPPDFGAGARAKRQKPSDRGA